MKRLLAALIFLVLMPSLAWALPPCPESGVRNNCFGTYNAAGSKYVGEWKDDQSHGQGTEFYASGDKYVGAFRNGVRHGLGTLTFPNGAKFVGEYRNGKRNGLGTHTWTTGTNYVGEYRDGKRHGHGTLTWGRSSKWAGDKYVGEHRDGKPHGQGTYIFADGRIGEGVWENGVRKSGQIISPNQRQPTKSPPTFTLDKAEKKCAEIGFTKGTEKFGDCVMKLLN